MNGIIVPEKYKKELKRSYMKREYAEACIRDYVKARPNIPITYEMFSNALEGRNPSNIIPRLIKTRKLTRRKVKISHMGTSYIYEWHDDPKPVVARQIQASNGEVVTVHKHYATILQLKQLDEWFMDFCNDREDVGGANEFRKFIHKRAGESAN